MSLLTLTKKQLLNNCEQLKILKCKYKTKIELIKLINKYNQHLENITTPDTLLMPKVLTTPETLTTLDTLLMPKILTTPDTLLMPKVLKTPETLTTLEHITFIKRANSDNNIYELIVAYFYTNPNIKNEDLLYEYMQTTSAILICVDLHKYQNNIKYINKKKYYDYYKKLQNVNTLSCDNIKSIFIINKSFAKYNELINCNKNVNKKQTKGDIYIKYNNEKIIAITVKQDNKCTETNYSIYKFFNKLEISGLHDMFNKLLEDNGKLIKNNKLNRELINKILYTRNNIYFNELKLIIENNKIKIKNELVNDLLSNNLEYDIYKFNGDIFSNIKKDISNINIVFEECDDFYKTLSGVTRQCAKMFYKLFIDNLVYRVEIRWKGNFTAAPQFMCYLV